MIIQKKDYDESGAFYICTQKFRYNNEICQRIFRYIQRGGAILYPVNFSLPANKIFEEFSLSDCCEWTNINRAINDIACELKNRQIWRAEVAFGKYSENINIDKLGWLIQYNSETMSETEFRDFIVHIADTYNCKYAITKMPSIVGINEVLVSNIVGVRCYWGMGSYQIAHHSYETILSNYYN